MVNGYAQTSEKIALSKLLGGRVLAPVTRENPVDSTHSAHPARMAPLTSGPAGLSVDSIAASLKPAASTNASTCVLS